MLNAAEEDFDDINCFGCAPANPIGLRLTFETDRNQCKSRFALGCDYESYPGVIHGGVVATVLDEILSQVVYRYRETSAFTVGLRVRYGHPMQTDIPHIGIGEVMRASGVLIRASGRIHRETGELVAAATGSFYPISKEMLEATRTVSRERRKLRVHEPDGTKMRGK